MLLKDVGELQLQTDVTLLLYDILTATPAALEPAKQLALFTEICFLF
jgi:hypothetical protein